MKNCIFCQIVQGKIPSTKVWEDRNFMAILDIFPNTKGMTLVLTKKHYDSDALAMPDRVYCQLMVAAKKVGSQLKKALKVTRVALVMEGMGVNHAHIKLYPIHGLDEDFKPVLAKKKMWFKKYPGYVSTQLGPQADPEGLQELAKKISRTK